MLEHIPHWLGAALKSVRAGAENLAIAQLPIDGRIAPMELTSPAFPSEGRLPERFTADGDGVSPPLTWGEAPAGTAFLALLVEDADAPAPAPLVHAVVWGLPAGSARLEEGAIAEDGNGHPETGDVGRNSFFREGWLPPDPPTGHGDHRYAFQLFALGEGAGDPGASPGRSALIAAMDGHVVGAGLLIGRYSRGEARRAAPEAAGLSPA